MADSTPRVKERVARSALRHGPRFLTQHTSDHYGVPLHEPIRTITTAPTRCERCGLDDPTQRFEWANLTGRYDDPDDYERMCVSCHRRYDAARRTENA